MVSGRVAWSTASKRKQGRRPKAQGPWTSSGSSRRRTAKSSSPKCAKKIDELGIEYLYLQFVSVTGRICGKGIPADHWESVAEKGFQLVYGATMNLFVNRRGDYLGYGPEAAELVGIPEPETFMQLPWDKRVARLWCTLFRNREERTEPGAFLTADARGNLRRLHDQFQKDHGLQLRHGTEPEMMWLKKGEDGQPAGGYSNPYCYHIDQFESLRPVYMRVIDYCRKMGLDMIQGDHEDSPGQLELNFTYDDALRTADRLATYRQICAQVAREFNIIACFMCKPFMGVSANGCHHNISLWRGGKDKIKPLGNDEKNLPGMDENYMYAQGRRQYLHARYRRRPTAGQDRAQGDRRHRRPSRRADRDRLLDGQFLSPAVGYRLLGAGLRRLGLPEPHHRLARLGARPVRVSRGGFHGEPASDGVGLLMAMDDGLKNNLDPGPPEERNIYQAMEAGKQVKKLPMTLGDALAALEKDRSSAPPCRARCIGSTTNISATSGSALWPP